VWSAGCSTGEEPYSIACLLHSLGVADQISDTKILATDIDTDVLAKARAATYDISDIEQLPKRLSKAAVQVNENYFQFTSPIADLISFKRLNLLQPWPMKGSFEFIFCRNVMIYFSAETKASVKSILINALAAKQCLFCPAIILFRLRLRCRSQLYWVRVLLLVLGIRCRASVD